jgi:hypothetical protein
VTAKTLHPRVRAATRGNFLERLLAPIDLLAEAIFSILIVLLFTLGFGIAIRGQPDGVITAAEMNELILAAFGATVAYGAIDGVLYILLSVLERGERHRILTGIQSASSDEEAVAVLSEEFDHIFEPITSEKQRQLLYVDVLEHLREGRPRPVGFHREDFVGAAGSVLTAVVSILPSFVPLVLLRQQPFLALRLSNIVSFTMLFAAGYVWGRYTGANPWRIGLLLFAAALIMVLIAIPLGG